MVMGGHNHTRDVAAIAKDRKARPPVVLCLSFTRQHAVLAFNTDVRVVVVGQDPEEDKLTSSRLAGLRRSHSCLNLKPNQRKDRVKRSSAPGDLLKSEPDDNGR